jgi:N-carbamoyl-L-amino-acid hydrolase
MKTTSLRIDTARLNRRLGELGKRGALAGGGVCRLALTDEDRAGRELVVGWMRELGLEVAIDRIGNVIGIRKGSQDGPPVVTGSHIDTVATGGLYDGNLGVLGGLEVIARLNEAGIATEKPLAVGFFTNEEGARFAPDMMGSGVHQGSMSLEQMLSTVGIDGCTVVDELERIGYAGDVPCGNFEAQAYLELHIEQGPVLEQEGTVIGAVTGVQGISWTEVLFTGTSNHAGTTPMSMRCDAGHAAAELTTFVRGLTREMGGAQVGTVGSIRLEPDLINVIASKAKLTIDLRNTDARKLVAAEQRFYAFLEEIAGKEGVQVEHRSLARFEPVDFHEEVIARVESRAQDLGHSVRRLPSGAGHDAQMFAPNCPSGMIFVPSAKGVSHNVREFTEAEHIEAGGNVLLQTLLELAG